jgi:fumarate hydratase class I
MKPLHLPDCQVMQKTAAKMRWRKTALPTPHIIKSGGRKYIELPPGLLEKLAFEATNDAQFLLHDEYLQKLADITTDKKSSKNDRFTAALLLENARVAAQRKLPLCQDTGTVSVYALKGGNVISSGDDAAAIARGIAKAYTKGTFRLSQMLPLDDGSEKNSDDNTPAQTEIFSVQGNEYLLFFGVKGGGSANRTRFYAKTADFINGGGLEDFMVEEIRQTGAAACPPYSLAFVIGGTSPELCLKTASLAANGWLDSLPETGNGNAAWQDKKMAARILKRVQTLGIGAQFGGIHAADSVRVIRMARHAASAFIGLSVGCCARRHIAAKINSKGVWLEKLETDPARFITPATEREVNEFSAVKINLNLPKAELLKQFKNLPSGSRVLLSGNVILARDLAHARFAAALKKTGRLPDYLKKYPIFYAGPCKTPKDKCCGSCGPTTSARMDAFMPALLKAGAAFVTIGKGPRSKEAAEAIKRQGAVYLTAAGGAAAVNASKFITKMETIAYPELGMEAVRLTTLKNFPAFVAINERS